MPQSPSHWIRPWGFSFSDRCGWLKIYILSPPVLIAHRAADVHGDLRASSRRQGGTGRAYEVAARPSWAGGRSARSVLYAPENQKSRRQQRDFCQRTRSRLRFLHAKETFRATGITAPCVGAAQRRTHIVFPLLMHGRRASGAGVVRCTSDMTRAKKCVPCIRYGHGDTTARTDVCRKKI